MILSFLFSFFFHLTYSRWTPSLPSCLWSQRIFPSLPGSRLTFFYRDASSALLQQYQDYTEPPALPCRDDALVNQGHEVAKPRLSPVEIRKSTSAGSFLHAGATSITKTQGTNFPPLLLPWSFRETSEEKNIFTTRQTFAKYNRSWHPKVIETKSRQNMVFDPGGLSGCLCGCPFWEGGARCIVGGLIREAFAIRYNYPCFSRFQYVPKFSRE